MFADDAAVVSHIQDGLQHLMDRFSHACRRCALPCTSIKETGYTAQDASSPSAIDLSERQSLHTYTVVGKFQIPGLPDLQQCGSGC